MVSKQIPGTVKFYRITPTGSKVFITGLNVAELGPSGSSEGLIASTPEKWVTLPAFTGPKQLQVNDKLHVTFTPISAETVDATDCAWAVPIRVSGGGSDSLGKPSDATIWDSFVLGDVALIAGREYPVCEKIVRFPFALGGGKVFLSIEDNS